MKIRNILGLIVLLTLLLSLALMPTTSVGQSGNVSQSSYKQGTATTQSITSAAAGTGVDVTGYSYVSIMYKGTYTTNSTTAGFQVSLDSGTTYIDREFYVMGTTNTCLKQTATGDLTDNSTNVWIVPVAGFNRIRTNALNWASGTINVTIVPFASPASPCQLVNWLNPLSASIDAVQVGDSNGVAATVTSAPTSQRGLVVRFPDSSNLTTLTTLTTLTGGGVAHDGADSGNPVKVGFRAVNAPITAVANNDRTDAVADLNGRLINAPYTNPENMVSGVTAAITGTSDTSVIAAAGAGVRNYVTSLSIINSHATVDTVVELKDGTTVIWRGYAKSGGGGFTITFPVPLRGTANTAINCAAVTTGANVYCSAAGYKAP